jgi:hypothetical protein
LNGVSLNVFFILGISAKVSHNFCTPANSLVNSLYNWAELSITFWNKVAEASSHTNKDKSPLLVITKYQ